MNNIIKIEKFKKLAKGLKAITRIVNGVSAASAILCFLVIGAMNIFPTSVFATVGTGMRTNSERIGVDFGRLSYEFPTRIFSAENLITAGNMNLINAIAILAATYFITLQLGGILTQVIADVPFNEESAKHIRYLGYGIIAASLIPLVNMVTTSMMMNALNLQELMSSGNPLIGIKINLHPINGGLFLAGLLIILLSNIFRYGSFLQEEFDSTL